MHRVRHTGKRQGFGAENLRKLPQCLDYPFGKICSLCSISKYTRTLQPEQNGQSTKQGMAGLFSRGSRALQSAIGGAAGAPLSPIGSSDLTRRIELLDSFENAGLGWFWATDAHGRLIYLSDMAAQQLGAANGEVIGKQLTELFVADQENDPEQAERPLTFLLKARNSITQFPVRLATDDGNVWWEIAGKPQFDLNNQFTGYRGSAKDITKLRETRRDAERLAEYNSLTGLANRHRMTSRLERTLKTYRNAKRSCALIMLDLDRFKQVNDTLGHPAGDELLKQVAARLERIIGTSGEIGRLGGDEFLIMLPDVDDRGTLGDIGQRLIQMISQPYSANGARAIIGTSVGIAVAPYDGLDADELVKAADLALYAAKGGGRGNIASIPPTSGMVRKIAARLKKICATRLRGTSW